MKYVLVFLVVLGFVAGCDKEDPSRPIFTFTMKDDFYAQYNAETWVVIRNNDNGELIDSKQVLDKNPIVFESSTPIASNKLAITILRVYTATHDNKNNYAQVYNGIDVGSSWIVAQRTSSNQITIKATGTFQFRIEDVPNLKAFAISDKFGDFSYNVDYVDNTITGGFSIHEGASAQLLMVDIGEKPRHIWLDGLTGGEQVNLSYSNLQDFDHYIRIDFPEDKYAVASIQGLDDNFLLYKSVNSNPIADDHLDLGYLDYVNNYETYASTSDWDHDEKGPMPASVKYLDGHEFQTSGVTIENYTISATAEYKYSTTNFSYFESSTNTSTQILYWNPEGTTKLHDPLTEDLVSKYSIPMDKIRTSRTTFSLGDDDSYESQIRYLFDPAYEFGVTKSVHVMK